MSTKVKINYIKSKTHASKDSQPIEWENKFSNYMFNKWLIFRIHKELLQLNDNQKTDQNNEQKIE